MTTPKDEDRTRKRGAVVWITSGLAVFLMAGTAFGLVQALDDSSADRVVPSSTAPVYGAR